VTSAEFATLLGRLAAGERPTAVQLTLLSDLGPADRDRLAEVWTSIPAESRVSLLERTIELAEDNVELDFAALALVAIADPDVRVRRLAAEALWESRDRRVARALVEAFEREPDPSVRAAIATTLGTFVQLHVFEEIDDETGELVVASLRAAAESVTEPADVRGRALASLGAWPEPWVDALIWDAASADDRELRLAALAAMANSEDERWLEEVVPHLASDDPEFRYWAAYACGRIGSESAIPDLAALLDDPDVEVARAAVGALGDIGGSAAIEQLSEFLPRAPEALRPIVEEALEAARAEGSSFFTGLLP